LWWGLNDEIKPKRENPPFNRNWPIGRWETVESVACSEYLFIAVAKKYFNSGERSQKRRMGWARNG
jgi:hypothetical protein